MKIAYRFDKHIGGTMKKTQFSAIKSLMLTGRWLTIPQIRQLIKSKWNVNAMETTISARIRTLRQSKHGGFEVERKKIPGTRLYKYRVNF